MLDNSDMLSVLQVIFNRCKFVLSKKLFYKLESVPLIITIWRLIKNRYTAATPPLFKVLKKIHHQDLFDTLYPLQLFWNIFYEKKNADQLLAKYKTFFFFKNSIVLRVRRFKNVLSNKQQFFLFFSRLPFWMSVTVILSFVFKPIP